MKRRASARRGRPKHAIPSRESVCVAPVTEASAVRPNAPKVDTVQSAVTFATARMTARATTWAIVSVNAAGPVNCARIDVPLVIQYIKSFPFFISFFLFFTF